MWAGEGSRGEERGGRAGEERGDVSKVGVLIIGILALLRPLSV